MAQIVITGFQTEAQAEAFIRWYEGQGEQDAAYWFENCKADGAIDVDFMPVDISATYPIEFENGSANMVLKV